MRVYEFSKKYDKSNRDVLDLLHEGGFEVGNHMSVLSEEAVQFLKSHYGVDQKAKPKSAAVEPGAGVHSGSAGQAANADGVRSAPKKVLVAKAMMLGDLADFINVPASSLILFLLRQGVACNRNQVLTKDQVANIAAQFEVEVVQPVVNKESSLSSTVSAGDSVRLPVVVVIGHVDHGKTTLLDFIRKTRVAAREIGGITQHLGAYRVDGPAGSIIFLDTPGHEAFMAIRKRGLRVADIAVLVVAADDGVMPQTIEAIRQAREVGLPIVVAINKIDKVGDVQIERVKKQLAQHGVTPEEWGGDSVMVGVSAKNGTNVDELLEMISLQAEMMELKTNLSIPACGYVLEAKMERGRGPVATFIAQHGVLRQGEFFVCGKVLGKVVSLKNSAGEAVSEAGPSIPVGVAGFEDLPKAGDYLQVVTEVEFRRLRSEFARERVAVSGQELDPSAIRIKLYVKADTFSSEEAVVGAIKKLSQAHGNQVMIVRSDIGDINEGDIGYADSVGASIYGFGVRSSAGANSIAKSIGVGVHLFSIIYELTDFLESVLAKEKKAEIVLRKVGEALVKKVFDIKGVGVIAGVAVRKGRITKGCEAVVLRDGHEVGRGPISSLQKDRKAVKEITAGYEGAFVIPDFSGWQEEDVVECFVRE